MVQRYVLEPARAVFESDTGNYVKYEDYAKLKAVADVLADEVDKFEAGERAFLEQALSIYRRHNK